MISRVRGTLVRREPGIAEIMTAAGVAYEIEVPLTVFEKLPREGAEIELRTVQVVREDSVTLYGFLSQGHRIVFSRLLTASGIGPRLALAMLSRFSPERLVRAIIEKDVTSLRQIPGLGTKKAEKLIVELSDRLDDLAVAALGDRPAGASAESAVGALVALGYTPAEASAAVRRAVDESGVLEGPDLIRAALAAVVR